MEKSSYRVWLWLGLVVFLLAGCGPRRAASSESPARRNAGVSKH
ncbi:MAG: hypothetical protein KatS3mg072_3084 [Meiothermus sp.]|nr:MAG: hypothetical protein KatS3mg072_3084 [Meiothermus sp.]